MPTAMRKSRISPAIRKRVHADAELLEQPRPAHGEAEEHDPGDDDGPAGDRCLLSGRAAARQAQEDRGDADGVDDDEKGQERPEGELAHWVRTELSRAEGACGAGVVLRLHPEDHAG